MRAAVTLCFYGDANNFKRSVPALTAECIFCLLFYLYLFSQQGTQHVKGPFVYEWQSFNGSVYLHFLELHSFWELVDYLVQLWSSYVSF